MRKYDVVIADDNMFMLDKLEHIIKQEETFKLTGRAGNGADLYKLVCSLQPDIVLLDLIMPGMDGIGVIEKVRSNKHMKKIPAFIILTSIGRSSIINQALDKGADYLIRKPFDPENVICHMKYYCSVSNQQNDPQIIADTVPAESITLQLESEVTTILHEIGIATNLSGFSYLRDSIILSVHNSEMLSSVTKVLYYEVAKLHNSTNIRVERSIRHVIDSAWKTGSLDRLHGMFDYTFNTKKEKPSNTELIAYIADVMRLKHGSSEK